MRPSPIVLACALLAFTRSTLAAKQCFFPNGTVGDWLPCNDSEEDSACCAPGDACMSNGYCFQQSQEPGYFNMRVARGMCTDWNSPNCPSYCSDVIKNGTITVALVEDTSLGGWCCTPLYDSSKGECTLPTLGSSDPFTLPAGQIIWDRKTGSTVQYNTTAENGTAITTTTVTATPSSKAGNDKNNDVAIGVGVAVPLGVLLLAAIAAVVLLMTKLKRLGKRHEEMLHHQQLLPQDSKVPYPDLLGSHGGSPGEWVTMQQTHSGHSAPWSQSVPPQEAPVESRRFELATESAANEAPNSPAFHK